MEDYNPFTDPAILDHQNNSTSPIAQTTATTTHSGGGYASYVVGNNEPAAQYVIPSNRNAANTSSIAPGGGMSSSGVGPPPPYSANSKPITSEELLKQQDMLEKKAAELDRKEREINQREAAAGIRPNNFPPIPSFIPIQPCFYQDFDVDIAQEYRLTVKYIYYIYLALVLTLLINVIGCVIYVACDGDDKASQLVFGILILALGTPCGYACWMRAVYNAFKKDSSFSFFFFFFTFFLEICLLVLFAIGPPGYGTCGWIVMFEQFADEHYFAGIVSLVISVALTGLCAAMILMLQRVHAYYRHSDASFEKAQAEFSTGVMSNRHVQTAAASAARSAAQNAAATNARNP